jgi:DNA-binding HxlR family transcriptional regulator
VPDPAGPDPQIEASFRRFRESAVRLVEQVSDRLERAPGGKAEPELDPQMIRAIFGKWSADILLALHRTPSARFEDLRRSLAGISARVLSIKLKELQEIGMVTREVVDARPPRVQYGLSERGWTVTWLARPIFLYIGVTEQSRSGARMFAQAPTTVGGPTDADPRSTLYRPRPANPT